VGLPALEPGRFHSWQADRDVAEAAQAEVRNLIADIELSEAKRDAARAAMSAALGVADGGGPIAPVLARAERRRAEFEDVARKRLLSQAELDQLDVETAALDRRQRVAQDAGCERRCVARSVDRGRSGHRRVGLFRGPQPARRVARGDGV
jgi:hypothetical protein